MRGDKRLGADTDPVDRHKTLLEYRIPDELGGEAVTRLNQVNALIMAEIGNVPQGSEVLFGAQLLLGGEGPVKLGFRVFDND